jgi:uncharacterized protein YtpQ (UPF0354 family)
MADQDREIEEALARLRKGTHSRDSIALLAAKLIELRNPNSRAEFASESEIKIIWPDKESISIFLHNLWNECERSPEERAEIVDRYVRILAPLGQNRMEASPKNVVALVRDDEFRNFVPEEERDFVTNHFFGDLWVILAVDLPESIQTLSAKHAASLGLEKRELIRLGIENVERMLGQMEFSPYGECFTLSCESISYASTALLLDYVWDQAASLIEGDLIVAIPARDTVLFTGSANAKGLKEIREESNYIVSTGHHVVSSTLLRRVSGGWKAFD